MAGRADRNLRRGSSVHALFEIQLQRKEPAVRIAILLLILAVLSGGLGLVVEGLEWAFVVALLLAVTSAGLAARDQRYGRGPLVGRGH